MDKMRGVLYRDISGINYMRGVFYCDISGMDKMRGAFYRDISGINIAIIEFLGGIERGVFCS